MKPKHISTTLILLSLFLLLSFSQDQIEEKRTEVLIDIVYQGMARNHYLNIELDDNYSEELFDLFLKRIDYGKRFLLQSDIDEFNKYREREDDEIKNRSHLFLDEVIDTMLVRIDQTEPFVNEILEHPFDFKKDESYETETDKKTYASNLDELKDEWRKQLKFQTLSRLYNRINAQDKALEKSDTVQVKTFTELEEKTRKKVAKTYKDVFKRIRQLDYNDRRSVYLNCMTNAVDPHSTYFAPRVKENFDISMSGQFEGIGATLSAKDGYITVMNIVPGSASWRQGDLQVNDKILKVAQGDEEPVSVVDMRLDDAVKLIRGKKGTEVRLTVQKIDGSTVVVPIIRDVVVLEETYAKSAIINEGEYKIGYIYLPKFYADFNKQGSRNCSDDIKEELIKLNNENIDALIFDVRDNGGGSLQDVVKIGGFFIDEGPIVQVKARNSKSYVFRDTESGVVYNGPLTILTNNNSASASEILAAAMQDYNRAILVGTHSTFGKGTVQKVLSFDNILPPSLNDVKPLGALKVTMQKFYRINGGTTQLKGVIPDIILPDLRSFIPTGEKELDNPLAYDEISRADYDLVEQNLSKEILQLEKISEKRINSSKIFNLINQNASELKKDHENSDITLNFEDYKKEQIENEERNSEFKKATKIKTGIEVNNLLSDDHNIQADSTKMESYNRWHKEMLKDYQLYEGLQVTEDYLKLFGEK